MIGLKDIKIPGSITKTEHQQILNFIGQFFINSEDISYEKSFIIGDGMKKGLKTLGGIGRKTTWGRSRKKKIYTKGLARYIIGDEFEIEIPGNDIIYNTSDSEELDILSTKYLYDLFKDKGVVSDHVLYMWYDLFKLMRIKFIKGQLYINLITGPSNMFRIKMGLFSYNYYKKLDRAKLLEKEIELGYVNKWIGDPKHNYAYGHILREKTSKTLISPSWYIDGIMNIKQLNMWLTSRKQGKSSSAADIVVKELLADKPGYGRDYRQVRLFVDNEKSLGKGFYNKIRTAMGPLENAVVPNLHKNAGANIFTIRESSHEIVCNLTGNRFNVTSIRKLATEGNDTSDGEGLDCDVAILDECFRKAFKNFWKGFTDRMWEETEYIFAISTVNPESDIESWVYDEMIRGEAGGYLNRNTIRAGRYDNSITEFLNFEKKGLGYKEFEEYTDMKIQEDIDDPEKGEQYVLNRHFCCMFSKTSIFDCSSNIVGLKEGREDDLRIIGMDMARSFDHVGVVVFNVMTMQIEVGEKYPNMDYPDIINLAKELHMKYRCIIIGDRGGPTGEAVVIFDRDTHYIDYWIKTTGEQKGVFNEKDGYWTIDKGPFVKIGMNIVNTIVTIANTCVDLIEQLGDMDENIFKARGKKKDDVVFAMLYMLAFIFIIFGFKGKDDLQKWAVENRFIKKLDNNEKEYYDDVEEYDNVDYYNNNGVTY